MSQMWDGVSSGWAQQADFVDRHSAAATEKLLDALRIEPGSRVLEVACGPGGAGLAAARRVGRSGRVVLADVAPTMVAIAAERSVGLPQVSTSVSDQLAIDAPDESFDAVFSRHWLMFVPSPAAAVREAVRVLRPGGRMGAIVWDDRAANPWLALTLDAVSDHFGVPIPPPGVPGPFSLADSDALAAALVDGGLDDVAVERVSMPFEAESLTAWWDRVVTLAGPIALLLAAQEPAVRDAIRERALAAAAQQARPTSDGISLDGSSLVAHGRRAAG